MNITRSKLVTEIMSLIFNPELQELNDMLKGVHEKQRTLTGTPNFLFKGTAVIQVRAKNVALLDETVKPLYLSYLNNKELISKAMNEFHNYLGMQVRSLSSTADLMFIMPATVRPLLLKRFGDSGETPTLTELPKDFAKISELMDRIMLMRLL